MVQNTAAGAERSPSGDGPLGQRPPVREAQIKAKFILLPKKFNQNCLLNKRNFRKCCFYFNIKKTGRFS